jgi:hypothetical protein
VPEPRQNPGRGHRRIQGELARLGYKIVYSTVWKIMKNAGIEPAPQRSGLTWGKFLSAQAHRIIACDFLHVDTVLLSRLYQLTYPQVNDMILFSCGTAPQRRQEVTHQDPVTVKLS